MNKIRLLSVGVTKEPFFSKAEDAYKKKIQYFHKLEEITVKVAPPKLPTLERVHYESDLLSLKITAKDYVICLDEKGQSFTSKEFAKNLTKWIDSSSTAPCFIVGGAFGLSASLKEQAHLLVRLSDMTFPHELAKLVLLEQLYRAASINKGFPYHHE